MEDSQCKNNKNESGVKILQTNLNRSRAAHDMAHLIAEREGIDIILVGEPNRTLMKNPRWTTDKNIDVAVYFRNKDVEVIGLDKREGFIRIQFRKYNIYCCYCSPNISLDEFKRYIDILMNTVRQNSGDAIILGDLNMKSPRWGSPTTDARAEYFIEWMGTLDLLTHNCGNKPTFVRGTSTSYIDVTFSTQGIARNITNWKVLDDEPISDHSFIYFEIKGTISWVKQKSERQKIYFDNEKFRKELENRIGRMENDGRVSVNVCMEMLSQAYKTSCLIRNRIQNTRVPFWWSVEIESKRSECIAARRKLIRQIPRKNIIDSNIQLLKDQYKTKKKELKKLISKAKNQHWKDLCSELDANLWGSGYKIAVKHLQSPSMPYNLSKERMEEIVVKLFPNKEDYWLRGNVVDGVEEFTMEELVMAGGKMKSGKAPGPDRIPPEPVKEMIKTVPNFLLAALNELLRTQKFPARWKVARVCLLWKSGKPLESVSAFRPICLLDTVGKLYEILIRERLEKELEDRGGLSDLQFGFRKGRSTVQAVQTVLDTVEKARERWCALITLDIKNAFNSATWSYIIAELNRRHISQYIVNVIESYFDNRKLKINGIERDMTAGVPQGSVLGPTLWNILYDGVFRQDLGEDIMTICFADDLAILVKAEESEILTIKANEALRRIDRWLKYNDLELAPEKTEAVILKGGRNTENIVFELNAVQIKPSKAVRYLGIVLGSHRTFGEHINRVTKKAEERIASLSRLMPNIGGPRNQKRAVLSGVMHSILLYGAPVWHEIMNTKRYKERMERVQRKMLLRVASSYRTTSTKALQVITGIAPIELQVQERRYIYRAQGDKTEAKKAARLRTLERWQEMWDNNFTKGQWTKRLIPNIITWIECGHRRIDYYTTQVLTGHGSFYTYLNKIGAAENGNCMYCGEMDTAEHTLFDCLRWDRYRQETYLILGCDLNPDNLIVKMIESERNWSDIRKMIRNIMVSKEKERNERQRGNGR